MDGTRLPGSIEAWIAGKHYETDGIGRSESRVLLFEEWVLKIVKKQAKNDETVRVMRWLEGKLPVPRVLVYESDPENQYLLMTRMPGKMSCDAAFLEHPQELVALLAEGLHLLWSVDARDCPRRRDLNAELEEAAERVRLHRVDMNRAEPGTFGKGGFRDPEALLEWLEDNRPETEQVLSHGDFCLPNIFIHNGSISGMIDLGDTGTGDRWRDIALCWRSLKHNTDGTYGRAVPGFRPETLFDALDLGMDREKLRYYILLDELF